LFGSMTARAAVIGFLAIGALLFWRFETASPSQLFTFGLHPEIARPRATPVFEPGNAFGRHSSPYMMSPRIVAGPHNIEVDAATKAEILAKLEASELNIGENVQRAALLSIYRLSKKTGAESNPEIPSLEELLEDPSGEKSKQAAAYQIFFMARDDFDATVTEYVDVCLKRVLLTTKDPKERVDILDTCFYAFPKDYKDTPVESGMRLFRMLLNPEAANVASAKNDVRSFTSKLNKNMASMVEKWMQKTETGKMAFSGPSEFAEDCRSVDWDMMDMWMPFMPRAKNQKRLGPYECFGFEESLRNYQAVVTDLEGFAP